MKLSTRRLTAALVLLATAVASGPTTTSAARPVPPRNHALVSHAHTSHRQLRYLGDYFGIGTYIAKRDPHLIPPMLFRIRSTGANWVREEFTASDLHQRSNAPYHFARYDRVINRERANGLQVLGLLDYNNTFNGQDHTWMGHSHMRRLIRDFDRFVLATVRHYRGRISYWQIWNEPDLTEFWHPFPNAGDYARLLSSAYQTVKRADPKAQVLIAGPSGRDPSGVRYLRRVRAAGGRFDIVTIQPYEDFPDGYLVQEVRELRAFHRPIWFSEIGWAGQSGCEPCGGAQLQARRLATVFFISGLEGVDKVFWYDFRDDGLGRSFPDHFGLVEWNLAGKPAYRAFEISARLLNRSWLDWGYRLTASVSLYGMSKDHHHYYVLWNNSASWSVVKIPWRRLPIRLFDCTGQEIDFSQHHRLDVSMPPDSVQYLVGYRMHMPEWLPRGLPIRAGHTK